MSEHYLDLIWTADVSIVYHYPGNYYIVGNMKYRIETYTM